jgi:N-carbamoylputrescine amidase
MPADDRRLAQLAEACADMQVVTGFIERAGPGQLFNAAAVLRQGQVVGLHRKLNLPTYGALEEGKWYSAGRQLTQLAVRPGWAASHLICADLWNPGLVHAAMLHRPDLVTAPIASATGAVSHGFSNETHWQTNLRFYAMTYGTPMVMANLCGAEGETRFWGGSMILGPRGETLAAAGSDAAMIHTQLSRAAIAQARFELPTVRDADTPLVRSLLPTDHEG